MATPRQELRQCKSDLAAARTELAAAQDALAKCQADSKAQAQRITDLQGQNVALTDQVAQLEADLKACQDASKPTPEPTPTGHVALGAWAEFDADGKSTLAEQQRFDTLSQHPMAMTMQYAPWKNADGSPHKFAYCTEIYDDGRIPHVAWGIAGCPPVPDVAAGKWDAHVTQTAKNIAAIAAGRRFQLRMWWEQNGRWMPVCADKYGNDTTVYVAAWRRMADIFRANAPSVELVWSPAWRSLPDEPWNAMKNYYPGDAYVDVVGCSIYNKYGAETNTWRSFETLVAELTDVSATKPLMMSEGASLEDTAQPNRKAQWITDMGAYVKAHPRWEALLWFHRPPVTREPIDFRVDTSPPPLAAWRALAADAYYQP